MSSSLYREFPRESYIKNTLGRPRYKWQYNMYIIYVSFHYRLKTRATLPRETKAQTCQTACPDISEIVITILGVSECLETIKVRVVHIQKKRGKEKGSCKYVSGNEWFFSFIEKLYSNINTLNCISKSLLIINIISSKHTF
jgi:hypothetical protein